MSKEQSREDPSEEVISVKYHGHGGPWLPCLLYGEATEFNSSRTRLSPCADVPCRSTPEVEATP